VVKIILILLTLTNATPPPSLLITAGTIKQSEKKGKEREKVMIANKKGGMRE